MKPFMKSLVAIAWACLLVSACSPTPGPTGPPSLGGPTGSITWMPLAGNENPLPGIDQGTVYHFGTAFVVWSDAAGGCSGSSSGNLQGVKCQGSLLARDRRRVEFHCETKDGKTGQATINGAGFELADGSLFLVSAEGEQCRVKQLKRDMGNVKFERESLELFGRNDPDMVEFFSKEANAKRKP
jgi:hypothetical protein